MVSQSHNYRMSAACSSLGESLSQCPAADVVGALFYDKRREVFFEYCQRVFEELKVHFGCMSIAAGDL